MGLVPVWLQVLVGLLSGFLVVWAGLVVALWGLQRDHHARVTAGQVVRLLPDVVRLTRRLVADPQVPRGVRVRLALLLGYLLLPIDLVPDFIPVVGYADDAVIAALVIRSAIRGAGPEAIVRNWPGNEAGLEAVLRLARSPLS